MLTEDSIVSAFVFVDDFYLALLAAHPSLTSNKPKRGFSCGLNHSEVMTILLCFQSSQFRNFKQFYLHLQHYYKYLFPGMVSYSRFVSLMKDIAVLFFVFVNLLCKACTGLSFIDSTPLAICKNIRINRNKVFRGLSKRGNPFLVKK